MWIIGGKRRPPKQWIRDDEHGESEPSAEDNEEDEEVDIDDEEDDDELVLDGERRRADTLNCVCFVCCALC